MAGRKLGLFSLERGGGGGNRINGYKYLMWQGVNRQRAETEVQEILFKHKEKKLPQA